MPPKKSRSAKSGLNYESLIHYMRHETYPKYVVSEHEKRNIRKRSKSFRLQGCSEGDKLYFVYTDDGQVKQEKEVIYTHEDQQRVFDEFHINEKGVHLGREKLLNIISQKYYWQGICHKIREFLRGCKECRDKMESQQMKKHYMEIVTNPEDYIGVDTKVEETLDVNVEDKSDLASVSFSDSWITSAQQSLDPCYFWDIVEVKLIGPFVCNGRMKHVMVFMDVFSLWPEAAIVETMSSTVVTHVIINLICRFGVMNKLLVGEVRDDMDNHLIPRTDVLLASDINIDIQHISALQTVQAWNEIGETMNHFVANNPDWTNCLSFALLPHRISRGRTTEYSPAFLTYGRELKLPVSLSHQPSAESLQASDDYITVDKKKESLDRLMSIYKGYCGPVNISQESDVFKIPSKHRRSLLGKRKILDYEISENVESQQSDADGDINSAQSDVEASSSVMSEEEDNVADIEIKKEVDSGEEEQNLSQTNTKGKRWSKTHRTTIDNSSNNSGDLSIEEFQAYEKLLEIDENHIPEKLMSSEDEDTNYEALLLYLKTKRYHPSIQNEHLKRGIRKMSESHFVENGILYHRWKTTKRVVPLRFDERYYLLESYHTDGKGRHFGFRTMYERLNRFHWKGMIVDCEAYARTCVHCNQTKSMNHENLAEYFYDDTDEKRAKLAEENYSLLVKYLQKGKIVQSVQHNKTQLIIALANWFTLKNGQLYYKKPNIEYDVCLEVATRAKKNAIREAHEIPGMGIHASHTETLQTLREKFIWCGMKDNCEDFVINCCNQPKPATLKRIASLKKFDLQQRVSLFQKIRTMEDPVESEKYKVIKTKVLEKFDKILEDDDDYIIVHMEMYDKNETDEATVNKDESVGKIDTPEAANDQKPKSLILPVLKRTETEKDESEANVLRVKVPKLQDKQHTTETIVVKVHGTKLLTSSQPQAKIISKQTVSRDKEGKSLLNEQVIAQCQNKTQQQIVTNLDKLREGPKQTMVSDRTNDQSKHGDGQKKDSDRTSDQSKHGDGQKQTLDIDTITRQSKLGDGQKQTMDSDTTTDQSTDHKMSCDQQQTVANSARDRSTDQEMSCDQQHSVTNSARDRSTDQEILCNQKQTVAMVENMEHATTQGHQKSLTSAEANKQTTVLAQHQAVAIAKNLKKQKSHIQDDTTHQTASCGSQQTIGNEKIGQTIECTSNVSQQQTDKFNQQQGIPVEDALILISPEYADGNLYTEKNSANIKSTSSNIDVQTRKFGYRVVENRVSQTDYNRCVDLSDEVTLSAVKSILPSDEDNGSVSNGEDEGTVISWRSVLLVEETGVPRENHQPVAANDDSDPDWKCKEELDKSPTETKTSIVVDKEPDWEKEKKRYDNKTRFRCKFCGKCIKGTVRYRTHVYEHTGVKPFVCEHCPKRFTTPKTKRIHMLRHNTLQQFLCNLCGKGFSTNMSLKSHINVHEKGGNIQVKCELCPRVFTSRNRYEKHIKFKHPSMPEEYKCVECDKDFTTRRSLIRHNKSLHQNIKSHVCEICGKGFYRKEYLKSHLSTHSDSGKSDRSYVKRTYDVVRQASTGVKFNIGLTSTEVPIPQTVQYTSPQTITGGNVIHTEYTIPLSGSHHIALPSTTVENQMTVEPSFFITNAEDETQVAHMLVYEQPAVQYEVECGSSSEQLDAAEALSAINMLAQASISQGF